MAGARIGHYQLEELLGRGGMGEVYRAYDTRRNRRVALKLLSTHLSEDQEYRRRFRLESDAAARLNEPHVIPVHDFGEIDGRLYIDMRLVEGPDLGTILERTGHMPPERSVDIISQLAAALDAAHSHNLVHRDVKPANVLITHDQNRDFVYLVDFGVAFAAESAYHVATRTGTAIGTVEYMAPERFDGRPTDRRVDVYSLACVLHECLTAMRPFTGGSFPALMRAHLHDQPPRASQLRPGIPPALDDVVARGMAKDPGARYSTAGQLAAAARAALATATVAGPPPAGPAGPFPVGPPRQQFPETMVAPLGNPPPHFSGHPFAPPPPLPPARKSTGRYAAIAVGAVGLVATVVLSIVLITNQTNIDDGKDDGVVSTATSLPPPDGSSIVTSSLTTAQLFGDALENGDCTPVSPAEYMITVYDVDVTECGNEEYIRYFYKHSKISPDSWASEVQSGRSNYQYDNFTLQSSGSCYDTYTATRTDTTDGSLIKTVLFVLQTAPFVAEVYARDPTIDFATIENATFDWTTALC